MNTTVRENHELEKRQPEQLVAPAASVIEDANGYLLQIEMPGVNKKGLEITIEDNELTVIGRRSLTKIDGALIHHESRRDNYRRTFEMDPSIDAGRINATMEQGILTLTLPKAEHVKPRKIAVS